MDVAIIGVVAVLFALMGIAGLVRPATIMSTFGAEVATPEVRNEVRAVYGGIGLATAATLVLALAGPENLRDGLVVAVALANAGLAFGRLVSLAIERPRGFHPVGTFLVLEAIMAGALLLAV